MAVDQESPLAVDAQYLQLLDLVDEFEERTQKLQAQFSLGFLGLSQANFSTGFSNKRFGRDYWDLSPRVSSAVVEWEAKDLEPGTDLQSLGELNETTTGSGDFSTTPTASSLRNRREKTLKQPLVAMVENQKEPSSRSELNSPPLAGAKDPIRMFNGGLVPQTLRQSQTAFKESIPEIIALAKLRCQITTLLDALGVARPTPAALESPVTVPELFDVISTMARLGVALKAAGQSL